MNVRQRRLPPVLSALLLAGLLFAGPAGAVAPAAGTGEAEGSPYRGLDRLKEGTILHVPTGVELTVGQMIGLLEKEGIVYVGEVHTNMAHHHVQLEILQKLSERFPGKVAVGMEIFQRPLQPLLDRWSRGEVGEKSFLKEWQAHPTEKYSYDYGYYKEILGFIRDKKIPLIGLNASDEDVKRLSEKGLSGLTEEERRRLPEIDAADSYHRTAMKALFKGHGPGSKDFERFYQVMLLWDETMAETVANYLKSPAGRGMKMVVFAGGFHVGYGFGIPRRVFRRLPESYATVLPHSVSKMTPAGKRPPETEAAPPEASLPIADFVWATGYEELPAPPTRLGVEVETSDGGVRIKRVFPHTPASQAGLKEGDLLFALADQPIHEPFDLIYELRNRKAGDRVLLKVRRGDRTLEIEPTLVPWED